MELVELPCDESNEAHIARHGVTSQEVIDVAFGDNAIFATDGSHRQGRLLVFGVSGSRRYLLVVIDKSTSGGAAYVVTVRPMTAREHREYSEAKR